MIGDPPNGALLGTVIQVRRVLVRVRWDEMRRSRKWDTSDVAPHFLLPLKGEK